MRLRVDLQRGVPAVRAVSRIASGRRRKLVVFEVEQREASAFEALSRAFDVELVEEPLSRSNAARFADASAVSTFIYSTLDRSVLEKLTALRFVATRSTGYDHIDLAYCGRHGIVVSNVPEYGANSVAEHVFALLLAISHRLIDASERARTGHFSPANLQGFELAGKTLGVVGTGSIGRHVVRIAKGFAMDVVACDIKPDPTLARSLAFRYASLNDVLTSADVLTLHVPAQAKPLIADREFRRMKTGSVIINTARGSLIDARALIQALSSGKIAAAGLDVLPDEPAIREEAELICTFFCNKHDLRNLVADHVLLRMNNVIVTPHSAFNTREAVKRIVDTTVENISSFAAGRPQNRVVASSVEARKVGESHDKNESPRCDKRLRRHR